MHIINEENKNFAVVVDKLAYNVLDTQQNQLIFRISYKQVLQLHFYIACLEVFHHFHFLFSTVCTVPACFMCFHGRLLELHSLVYLAVGPVDL